MTLTERFSHVNPTVNEAAYAAYRKWRRHVEWEDLTQHLWVWLAEKWPEVQTLEPAELLKRLKGAAERYCRKEKATRAGYDTADEYFYSLNQLKRILPEAFDPDATPPGEPYRDDEKYSEWVTEVAEVRAAVRKRVFPLRHYSALRRYVETGNEDDTVRDALWALQRQLGGSRPR